MSSIGNTGRLKFQNMEDIRGSVAGANQVAENKPKVSWKSVCLFCGKKTPNAKTFCDRKCKESHFQLIVIMIPMNFVKRVQHFNDTMLQDELRKFAEFQKYSYDLVAIKYKDALEKYKNGHRR